MECLAPYISHTEATLTSAAFSLLYVLSLYLPFNAGARNTRAIILSRILTLAILALLLELYTRHRLPAPAFAARPPARLAAPITGALLTLLLYTGHLVATPRSSLAAYSFRDTRVRYQALRNYVAAPLLEELVFRRQILLFWGCHGPVRALLFPAAMFALAHAHHAREVGVVGALFQMAYTFLFGVYAAALYVNTGSFCAPVVAHVICNVLELPDFAAIAMHPRRRKIVGMYCAALAVFAVAFGPLTTLVHPYRVAIQ